MSEALVKVDQEMSIDQLKDQVSKVQEVMKAVMKEGHHYGKIPGCGPKPTLLKPGAEKLGFTFRLAPKFTITQIDGPGEHREFVIDCELHHIHTGDHWGSGVGCCSTKEKKYRSSAPADVYNTVLKIAKKRAHVDAILTSLSVSDIFTQDIEETRVTGENDNSLRGEPGVDDTPHAGVCPDCGADAIIKGKEEYGGGWLCWKNNGGCGHKWSSDPRLEPKVEVLPLEPAEKKTLLNDLIDSTQRKFLFEVAKNGKVENDSIMAVLGSFGYEGSDEIKTKDYKDILARIEAISQLQALKQV